MLSDWMERSNEKAITPRQLHDWYLEATRGLNPDSFNPNAQKSYDALTDGQRAIDLYIAREINKRLSQARSEGIREGMEIAKSKFKHGRFHKTESGEIHFSHGCVPKEDCANRVEMARSEGYEDGVKSTTPQVAYKSGFDYGWNKAISEAVKVVKEYSCFAQFKGITKGIAEKLEALKKGE